MIDREKVAVMTREAMEEKHNRRTVYPAKRFFRYDYVSLQVIKGVFGVTGFYVLAAACWLVCTMDSWISSISLTDMLALGIRLGVIYAVIAVVTILILMVVYSRRYRTAQAALREQEYNLKRLCRIYDREDRKEEE